MPTLTIEYATEAERLRYESAVAYVQEMARLGATAAPGTVIDACETFALDAAGDRAGAGRRRKKSPGDRSKGRHARGLTTALGPVSVSREYFWNADGGSFRADAVLGIDGARTRQAIRLITLAAVDNSFARSQFIQGSIKQNVNLRLKRSGACWKAEHVGPLVELRALSHEPEWQNLWNAV